MSRSGQLWSAAFKALYNVLRWGGESDSPSGGNYGGDGGDKLIQPNYRCVFQGNRYTIPCGVGRGEWNSVALKNVYLRRRRSRGGAGHAKAKQQSQRTGFRHSGSLNVA